MGVALADAVVSDGAIATIVAGLVTITTMVVGFFTLWVKLKYSVEDKIDNNTKITKEGVAEAATNAKEAANAAAGAKTTVEDINRKLNGGVEAAVVTIKAVLAEHATKFAEHEVEDKETAREMFTRVKELTEYVHKRNHDILGALNGHSLKIDMALEKIQQISDKIENNSTKEPKCQ